MTEPLLRARDICVSFGTQKKPFRVVENVSFDLFPRETLAIVGESGSGKSVTMLAATGLLKKWQVQASAIEFGDIDVLAADDKAMRKVRGKDIGMIFQDPMTSLNPVLTIGRQLSEMFELHMGLTGRVAQASSIDLLKLVGVPSAEQRISDYPHQFSGGMRQRVMIAMAVACKPRMLIADEPTTALDVTIQAQILEIIGGLQREFGLAMVIITHDLGVVAGIADRMLVMHAGSVVEAGTVEDVFANPQTEYTRQLLQAVPRFDLDEADVPRQWSKGAPSC